MATGSIQFLSEARIGAKRQLAEQFREVARRSPYSLERWRSLSRMLFDLGRAQEAFDCTGEALARFPDDAELRATRISAAIQLGDTESALAEARSLWHASLENPIAGRALLDALAARELWEEVSAAARSMQWVTSDLNYSLRMVAQQSLQMGGEPEQLLAHCNLILAQTPGHTDATYYKAVALARLGRESEACDVMGLNRYLSISQLPLPPGYADAKTFREALAAEIRANPTLEPDPKRKSTRNGLQTSKLRQAGEKAVAALIATIEISVARYLSNLASNGGSLVAAAPAAAEIRSWAVIYGQDGYQDTHRHPGGWLSGVFYVEAPKLLGDGAHRGKLKLGRIDKFYDEVPPWGIHEIEPVPGRLVLFPSYTPHGTEPSGVVGERMCVAFDVVPVGTNAH